MKNLFFLFSITLFFFGCVPSKTLTTEQSEKVFEHSLDMKQADIRSKLLLFANENFVSSKSVIQTDDNGLFSGNGIVTLKNTTGLFGESLNLTKMELTFLVRYSDNNYRVKWIVKDLFNDKGSYINNIWGYYAEEIKTTIDGKDKQLFDYLADKENSF
jgi:hypothetical protein